MQYRVYLLGNDDHIRAAESFNANDDLEAREIVMALYAQYLTAFRSAELWRGPDMIMRQFSHTGLAAADLQKLIDKRQGSVAQLEEMLERSFECVRQSRQLMDTLHEIKTEQNSKEN